MLTPVLPLSALRSLAKVLSGVKLATVQAKLFIGKGLPKQRQ